MTRRRIVLLLSLLLAGVAGVFAFGHAVREPVELPASSTLKLEVDVSERTLRVIEDGASSRTFPVTVGSPEHPTPRGSYPISWLVWNPSWHPPDSDWARGKEPIGPGPSNPMGRVKMYFRRPAYYVHGTDKAGEIGRAASHGCVRLENEDVMELARLVMEHGGEPRPRSWFRLVMDRVRDTRHVELSTPVALEIHD